MTRKLREATQTGMVSGALDSDATKIEVTGRGLASWVRTGTGKPAQSKLAGQLDLKRILALSAVLVSHTMVFGAMLLPAAPISAISLPPKEVAWIDVTRTPPPPPPPPKPIPPPVRPTPIVQPIAVTPPPIDPPVQAPILVATTSLPSDEYAPPITPTIVEPPTLVGGNVGESLLTVLRDPPPPYPIEIIRKGIGGTVEFSVLVGIDGSAQEIKLIKSSGNRKLDQSTLRHIKRRWRFKAPEIDGQAVSGWGRGKVTFTMEG